MPFGVSVVLGALKSALFASESVAWPAPPAGLRSALWLLAMFVPLLSIWAHVMWSFRIAGARGKGFWTALFLILPTYPLALLYLAFAGGAAAPEESSPPEKFKTTGLVFDQG